MSILYDGKLTAWLDIQLERLLAPHFPPVGKYFEGINSFEIKVKNPELIKLKQELIALAREYEAKQRDGQYEQPVEVTGDVHHGFEDD